MNYSRYRSHARVLQWRMLVLFLYNSCSWNLTRFDSNFRRLSVAIVLRMTRQKRIRKTFSWRIENRWIDCLERDCMSEFFDFDIRSDRINEDRIDKRTDYLSKYFNIDRKRRSSIKKNMLNISEFDESFEIDLWLFLIVSYSEIWLFRVRYLTSSSADSKIFEWMWKLLIRECSLEIVNLDYFKQLLADCELSSCWLLWQSEKCSVQIVSNLSRILRQS
jgi:hypothetical protein